jgi:iodotyrosine deiodinase
MQLPCCNAAPIFLCIWMKGAAYVNLPTHQYLPQLLKTLYAQHQQHQVAHKQPWTFCVVSNPEIKKQVRIEAEKEEYESYNGRMPEAWKKDLLPLQTDWHKEFLETAPYLIIVFKKSYDFDDAGNKTNVYYANESLGLACGFLLAAIHNAGLAALTHTPSPMNFLSKILQRPENEKPFLVIPVGYAAATCMVPDIKRKTLEQVSVWFN